MAKANDQSETAASIFCVLREMICEVLDFPGQESNLNVCRTGIFSVQLVLSGDIFNHTFVCRHEREFSGLVGLLMIYLGVIVIDFDNRINTLCASRASAILPTQQSTENFRKYNDY